MATQPTNRNINLYSFPLTDQGKTRSNNEDSYSGYEPTEPFELQQHGCLYIVADGVGGAQFGERASQFAARKILYDFYQESDTDLADRLARIIQNTGNEIFNYSVENGVRMATTLVAANIKGDRLTVANVGDSRAYLIRAGKVKQITRDHNRAAELVRVGMLTSEEAKESRTKNTLTRSLGGDSDEEVDLFTDIQLLPGDLILLCTDGLSRYASEDDLLQLSSNGTLEEIAKRMIDFANRAGGADNITLYLIKVNEGVSLVPSIPRGNAPEAIDWDTISTLPKHKAVRNKTKASIFTSIPHLVIMLVTAVALLAVTISIIASFNKASNQPDLTQIPTDSVLEETAIPVIVIPLPTQSEPTISVTNIPESTLAIATTVPTAEPTAELTTEPTALPGKFKCVHRVSQGEIPSMIFTDFFEPDIPLPVDDIYKIYYSCNLETNECYGTKFEVPATAIGANSFLVIPGVEQEKCSGNNNYWVLIPD